VVDNAKYVNTRLKKKATRITFANPNLLQKVAFCGYILKDVASGSFFLMHIIPFEIKNPRDVIVILGISIVITSET
jgi:hypothetical protein